jgi:hypothetical protein
LHKAIPRSRKRAHDSHNFEKTFLLAKIIPAIHIILQKAPKLLENMIYTYKFTQKTRTSQQLIQKVDLFTKNPFINQRVTFARQNPIFSKKNEKQSTYESHVFYKRNPHMSLMFFHKLDPQLHEIEPPIYCFL